MYEHTAALIIDDVDETNVIKTQCCKVNEASGVIHEFENFGSMNEIENMLDEIAQKT